VTARFAKTCRFGQKRRRTIPRRTRPKSTFLGWRSASSAAGPSAARRQHRRSRSLPATRSARSAMSSNASRANTSEPALHSERRRTSTVSHAESHRSCRRKPSESSALSERDHRVPRARRSVLRHAYVARREGAGCRRRLVADARKARAQGTGLPHLRAHVDGLFTSSAGKYVR